MVRQPALEQDAMFLESLKRPSLAEEVDLKGMSAEHLHAFFGCHHSDQLQAAILQQRL